MKLVVAISAATWLICANAYSATSLTVYGEAKYKDGFACFDYVNQNAPKGGRLNLGHHIAFDSLNGFALKGTKAPGIFGGGGIFKDRVADITLDSLMTPSLDEPQALYPLIAESVEEASDFSWVEFTLNPKAKFHDGSPITVEDVIFTFHILPEKGDPSFKIMLAPLQKVEKTGEYKVRFTLKQPDLRQFPLTLAEMPILSKAYWSQPEHALDKPALTPPLGSGPYKIIAVDASRSVTFERVKDYWAKDLPVNRGQNNFDIVHYQVYRDTTVALEGIKSGQYDLRSENISRNWATAYNIPAVRDGKLIKQLVPHKLPTGNQAFLFNTVRYPDRVLREAVGLAFDFEWTNHTIFFDAYTRNSSFFQNTEFAAQGKPSQAELTLLEPFRKQLPEEVFNEAYQPPHTNGKNSIRANLLKAQTLLEKAGYKLKDNKLIDPRTGQPIRFSFLYYEPSFNRVFMPFINNLKRLGIDASVRTVEVAQYQLLLDNKDFDIGVMYYNNGLFYPGAEQRAVWSCETAKQTGSSNIAGICNPALESIFPKLEEAKTLEELQTAARALDRVLNAEYYTIPQFHLSGYRLVYWDKFMKPKQPTAFDPGISTWWMKPEKQ